MTKWYSPKDKLLAKNQYVWGAYVYADWPEPCRYMVTKYDYIKCSWIDEAEFVCSEPTYFCHLPEVPQELIDKLKE